MYKRAILALAAFALLPMVTHAGSQTYSTPGTHTFTVPNYTGTLTVEMWGGGGAGSTIGAGGATGIGGSGGQSSWNGTVIAGAGGGGVTGFFSQSGGAGGLASGGDINTNGHAGQAGSPGVAGAGGSAPNGGAGGGPTYTLYILPAHCPACDGSVPGGGGGGGGGAGSGGGSGAYVRKTYSAGQLSVGTSIPVVVGGGSVGNVDNATGRGAGGYVKITWTDAAAAPVTPAAPVCGAVKDPTKKTTGTSGSQTFSSVGEHDFTVPEYKTLTVEVWGGGQYPVAYAPFMGETHGAWGGTSIFNHEVYAEGGHTTPNDPVTPGGAWGGDTNIRGNPPIQAEPGYVGIGGNAPFGGIGGFYPDPNSNSNAAGRQPGGGGGNIGCAKFICWDRGGASGGYAKKTYQVGDFEVGDSVWLYVGAGGNEEPTSKGGDGMVKISWTATGQTLSLCSVGYKLKDGKCVSTAVCTTCPAGQTLKTIPGSRIAATSGSSGTSGSKSYTTPGTYTFTVPANYSSLNVTVNGAGGGGSGAVGNNGEAGGKSSFKNTTIGNGGEGGVWDGGGAPKAANGSASGGNISNITGGGAAGGVSARSTTYGVGGSGGQAKSAYAPGDLPASVTVVVGAGGAPEPTAVSLGGGGKAGSNGSVTITWTGGASTLSCPTGYTLQGSECVAPSTTQCVPDTTCPAGYHFDEILQQCTLDEPNSCPIGTSLVGGVCACPAGSHWDTAQNMCVPDDQCPAGQHWNGTQCVADNCPAGQYWNGTACVAAPACPTGTRWDGLECVVTVTSTCPPGQYRSGTQCLPIPACSPGQYWSGSQCTLDTCPPGQHWDTTTRQCVAGCPTGTVLYQGRCQIGLCVPGLECGVDGNVYRRDLQCNRALFEECEWGCTDAACNAPPQPKIITWKVSPTLVKKNDTTGVFWNVINVLGCTVSGTNGDRWNSAQGTEVSGRIIARTTYTLHCTPYRGASWTDQTAVVNVVPVFQEQ